MKRILFAVAMLLSITMYFSCGKKDATPGYYFKFKADGIQYNYKYGCETGFVGTSCNIGAGQGKSSSFNPYFIYGYSLDNPAARGEVRFFLNKDDFDNLDTIVLDGSRNDVGISHLNESYNNYEMYPPLTGFLVLNERTESHLKGVFSFNVFHIIYPEGGGSKTVSDTVLHISEGEFFIRRTN